MILGSWKTERMMRRYAADIDQTLRAAAEAISGSEAQSSVQNSDSRISGNSRTRLTS
jgi:hypothetical protein